MITISVVYSVDNSGELNCKINVDIEKKINTMEYVDTRIKHIDYLHYMKTSENIH